MGRAMAEAGRLKMPTALPFWAQPVMQVRIAIVAAVLILWEAIARSGLLYQDVVPSLLAIGGAILRLLGAPDFYGNLWTTGNEVAAGLAIGGVTGLAVGLVLGPNRFLAKDVDAYLYYFGPTPKIIFFPVMIMWFGIGPGSKIAMGAISCFFPIALSVAAGMRQIHPVLSRGGKEFCRQ